MPLTILWTTYPSIAIDNNNFPHVVGSDGDEILYTKYTDSGWTISETISNTPGEVSWNPSISIDKNNIPHVVWDEPFRSIKKVFYTKITGSGWESASKVFSSISPRFDSDSQSLLADKSGKLNGDIYYVNSLQILDSDNDNYPDTIENRAGTDPLDENSYPNTPGQDVNPSLTSTIVNLNTVIKITYTQVTETGNTTFTSSSTPPVTPPSGYRLGASPTYYDINTTATFTQAEVCIDYDETNYGSEKNLRLLHYKNGWKDVTTSLDTTNDIICGRVSSFRVSRVNGEVIIRWATGIEIDNEGFNILRSESPETGFIRINTRLIPAEGGIGGHTYRFIDRSADPDKEYYYRLEDIDSRGRSTLHMAVALIPVPIGKGQKVVEIPSQDITHVNLQMLSIPSVITYEAVDDTPEISGDIPDAETETKDRDMPYSMIVRSGDRGIVIEWRSSGDGDLAGFNIWRSEEKDDLSAVSSAQAGGYLQINDSLITPLSDTEDPAQETRFSYTDLPGRQTGTDIEKGVTYYYRLERISIDGNNRFLEPLSIEPDIKISEVDRQD